MKTIHDRVTLEIARGCTRGCRFCQAGMVWRPVRERTPAVLEEMAEAMLRATGHDEISLLSLSSGDYTLIEPLLTTLMDRYYARRVALALPSLRAETLTPKLIEGIRRVRKTSFTLAPEAGTQRLRDVINKGNTEEELLATTERVFAAGWKAVKLYFMLGLPGEREEDLEGIAELAHKALRTAKNRGQVTVSLSTFVPKPHTPFQWQRQIGIEETAARQEFFRRRLKNRNISVKWHDARMSLLEGILSRGGEETGALIETAFRLGCRFDGWSDRFRFDLWEEALRRTGIDPVASLRERPPTGALPLGAGSTPASAGNSSSPRPAGPKQGEADAGLPHGCVQPVRRLRSPDRPGRHRPCGLPRRDARLPLRRPGRRTAGLEKTFRLRFTKLGPARFLSHMELSSALSRAMILGGISFVYSQGFHPHPKISFAGATAVGMESAGEFADIRIQDPREELGYPCGPDQRRPALGHRGHGDARASPARLLPGGAGHRDSIMISSCRKSSPRRSSTGSRPPSAPFRDAESFAVTRRVEGKTGRSRRSAPSSLALALDRASRRISLAARFGPEGTVRPAELIYRRPRDLSEETLHRIRIVKTGTRLADFAGRGRPGNIFPGGRP